jgi:purine-nucleoside/S-methyl-5'-thioadenosine phosphorylase / adenosine deaminase
MNIGWIDADWPAPPNIRAGTTLRRGGVSKNAYSSLNLGEHVQDDTAAVIENRRRFALECALPSRPGWLHQTHSVNVTDGLPLQPDPGTDAMITRAENTVCAVLTADCLPVVFAAADGGEVAVAHAGWRGLCNGIVEATVAGMHTSPAEILVWLGPAIAQTAFEVGSEVRDRFVVRQVDAVSHFVENANGRFQADLYGLAKQRLAGLGISAVYGGDRCTYAEPEDFFSYRRDGQCGRMATFVYRAASP